MGDLLQLDTVTPSIVAGLAFDAAAAYVDGYDDFEQMVQDTPTKLHRSVTTTGLLAQVADFENGALAIERAPGWFLEVEPQIHKAPGSYIEKPDLYSAISNTKALVDTMTAAGIARDKYTCWSAHIDAGPHICGPHTCDYPGAQGLELAPGLQTWTEAGQYTFTFAGRNIDGSLCSPLFYPAPPKPPDVMHYDRYPDDAWLWTRPDGGTQPVFERRVAIRYDDWRVRAKIHKEALDKLRAGELRFLLDRLYREVYFTADYKPRTPEEIQKAWHAPGDWRAWRFQRLRSRWQGSTVGS